MLHIFITSLCYTHKETSPLICWLASMSMIGLKYIKLLFIHWDYFENDWFHSCVNWFIARKVIPAYIDIFKVSNKK